jgi:hypothetical protein
MLDGFIGIVPVQDINWYRLGEAGQNRFDNKVTTYGDVGSHG